MVFVGQSLFSISMTRNLRPMLSQQIWVTTLGITEAQHKIPRVLWSMEWTLKGNAGRCYSETGHYGMRKHLKIISAKIFLCMRAHTGHYTCSKITFFSDNENQDVPPSKPSSRRIKSKNWFCEIKIFCDCVRGRWVQLVYNALKRTEWKSTHWEGECALINDFTGSLLCPNLLDNVGLQKMSLRTSFGPELLFRKTI